MECTFVLKTLHYRVLIISNYFSITVTVWAARIVIFHYITFMYGMHTECVRNAYGMRTECIRNAYGMRTECVRNAYGMRTECARNASGMRMECVRKFAWNVYGMRTECVRNAYGMRTEILAECVRNAMITGEKFHRINFSLHYRLDPPRN